MTLLLPPRTSLTPIMIYVFARRHAFANPRMSLRSSDFSSIACLHKAVLLFLEVDPRAFFFAEANPQTARLSSQISTTLRNTTFYRRNVSPFFVTPSCDRFKREMTPPSRAINARTLATSGSLMIRPFMDKQGHFWLEQNPAKRSKWAKLAREGHQWLGVRASRRHVHRQDAHRR